MSYKWLDDAFSAFQQETGDVSGESLREMMLQLEYWAEENIHDLKEARRTAKTRKKMFDAAKELLWEGFTPCQVTLILHDGIHSSCKPPSTCKGLDCANPICPAPLMPQDPSLWSAEEIIADQTGRW